MGGKTPEEHELQMKFLNWETHIDDIEHGWEEGITECP